MAIKPRMGGALQTASAISVKNAGVLRTVRTIRVMDAGVLQTVYSSTAPLSASASPPSGTAITSSSVATTDSVTITPSGGLGPYSYSWALISSTGGNTPTVNSPTSASTTFRQARVGAPDESNQAVFRCTVTDSLGATATVDVVANFEFTSFE